jgi:hypothetical protein
MIDAMVTSAPPKEPPPTASTWMDFEWPVETVRAIFFDVDHAIRARIHRGVRLKWLEKDATGARRIEQTMRVLDHWVVEELVVEEGPRATWVKRFVDGPNAGTHFVADFGAVEAGTRVELRAYVGKAGFALGLGKLSPVGLEKAMKRTLAEYKRALQGYEPGRARGPVASVLSTWKTMTAPMSALDPKAKRAAIATLLETAWSIAAVDDPPDAAERDAMRAVVAVLWGTTIDAAAEERMVHAACGAVAKDAGAKCDALGARLAALRLAELGVALAVLVAEVSLGLDPAELAALRRLTTAAGLDDAWLLEMIARVDDQLSGGDRASRMSVFV